MRPEVRKVGAGRPLPGRKPPTDTFRAEDRAEGAGAGEPYLAEEAGCAGVFRKIHQRRRLDQFQNGPR